MPRRNPAAEKRPRGRPPLAGETMRKLRVTLDHASIERALALGEGNLSAGIRRALERAARRTKERP